MNSHFRSKPHVNTSGTLPYLVEVVGPPRCIGHPDERCAVALPILGLTGKGQEALAFSMAALEVTQDEVEIRFGLMDGH